jgi:hypothetical protein
MHLKNLGDLSLNPKNICSSKLGTKIIVKRGQIQHILLFVPSHKSGFLDKGLTEVDY